MSVWIVCQKLLNLAIRNIAQDDSGNDIRSAKQQDKENRFDDERENEIRHDKLEWFSCTLPDYA